MARRFVNQYSQFPYHITSRCPNRELFKLNLESVWSITNDYLYLSNKTHGLLIHAFVLMPNHFHLIASSPQYAIGEVMRDFITNTSREINFMSGRLNQNWGGRHFKCVLDREIYFLNTYKYVYQNPVRAGLCQRVEDWKYSTLPRILGGGPLHVPVEEDTILFNPHFDENKLRWLNTKITETNRKDIRIALTRKEFTLPKTLSRKSSELESVLI